MKMVVERVTDKDRRELHCEEMHFGVEVEECIFFFFNQETDSHLKIRLEVFR